MFVADRLIYLQLHKTGCTQIAAMLRGCIPGRQVGKHNRLADDATDRYIVGSIRNPWEWYVSLWAFGCRGGGLLRNRVSRGRAARPGGASVVATAEGVFDTGTQRGTRGETGLGISNAWEATYADIDDAESFRAWLKLVFDPRTRNDFFRADGVRPITEILGLLTFRYLHLYCRRPGRLVAGPRFASIGQLRRFDRDNNLLDGVIRNESLESDLVRVLREAGYRLGAEQLDRIESGARQKRNASGHRPAAFYYDAETIRLVQQHEQLIIGKYAYRPPELE